MRGWTTTWKGVDMVEVVESRRSLGCSDTEMMSFDCVGRLSTCPESALITKRVCLLGGLGAG